MSIKNLDKLTKKVRHLAKKYGHEGGVLYDVLSDGDLDSVLRNPMNRAFRDSDVEDYLVVVMGLVREGISYAKKNRIDGWNILDKFEGNIDSLIAEYNLWHEFQEDRQSGKFDDEDVWEVADREKSAAARVDSSAEDAYEVLDRDLSGFIYNLGNHLDALDR